MKLLMLAALAMIVATSCSQNSMRAKRGKAPVFTKVVR